MTVNSQHSDRKLKKCQIMKEEVKYKPNLEDKVMETKEKPQYKSNSKDNLATNTAYSIGFKPFLPNPDINMQYHFTYNDGSLKASSASQPIGTSIPTKKIVAREKYSRNCDIKNNNAKTIKTNRNASTHIRTTTANINRPLSCKQIERNTNDIYKKKGKNYSLIPVELAPVSIKLILQQ
ncbi:hypothetical protein O181_017177 [Austropuccinia psidii MF-1]|uniref:Uncharacterized protein n=1 Tax=Austropuccinia psidii MF-1 TaxID=1389203 RepID=A0A9Q3GSC3_9BASI|nr:hypothetical protein [Austropuccinia psidii MF-1]